MLVEAMRKEVQTKRPVYRQPLQALARQHVPVLHRRKSDASLIEVLVLLLVLLLLLVVVVVLVPVRILAMRPHVAQVLRVHAPQHEADDDEHLHHFVIMWMCCLRSTRKIPNGQRCARLYPCILLLFCLLCFFVA